MKLKLLLAFIFFLPIVTFAQDFKKEIKTEFSEYITSIEEMNFEKTTEYILPDFFEIVPKNQLIAIMQQTFNNDEVTVKLRDAEIKEIGNPKKIENKFYALMNYSSYMDMKINTTEEDEEMTKEEKDLFANMMKVALAKDFGLDNVSYIKEKDHYEIYSEKDVYAVSDNGNSNWKFVVIEKDQKMILEKILPKKLIKKL